MSVQNDFSLMSHEGYKMAYEKWTDIKSQLGEAEASLQTLLFEGKPESVRSQKEKQVQAILDGQEPDDVQATEIWRENFARATQRRYLFIEALEVQERRISEERMVASKRICEKVLPKYIAIIQKKAEQLIALAESIVQEKELLEALSDENIGYSGTLIPMPLKTLGDPRDVNSGFAFWVKEAVRIGYLDFKSISKMFREKWYRSNGFKFPGDKLTSKPYNEVEYARRLTAGTVDTVLNKARKDGEPASKNVQ